MNRSRGFTLIELLVATMLSVVLTAGILSVASSLARDTRRLQSQHSTPKFEGAFEPIRHDLMNARNFEESADQKSLVIEGHGAIDATTLRPTGRLCRVTYQCRLDRGLWVLSRTQFLLDEPTAPHRWTTSICTGVSSISVKTIGSAEAELVPLWVQIRLAGEFGMVEKSEQLR